MIRKLFKRPEGNLDEAINKPTNQQRPNHLGGVYWEDPKTGKRYWNDGTPAPRDCILDLILRDRRRRARGFVRNWNTPPTSIIDKSAS
jgi:hypothetical protein